MSPGTPALRLGGLYFAYFAALGCLVPFFSRYLAERGHEPATIGRLMAVLAAARVLSPLLGALLIERLGHRLALVRLGLGLAALAFAGLLRQPGLLALGACLVVFHLFFSAVLPQFETLTLSHLQARPAAYSRIRLGGSLGYMLCVVAAGAWFDRFGVGQLPVLVLLAVIGTLGLTFAVPEARGAHTRPGAAAAGGASWRQPVVWALFLSCFCQQAATQPYYLFYDLFLRAHGYGGLAVGSLIALGVLAEIGMFLVIGRAIERWGVRPLMLGSIAIAALRWAATALWPEVVPIMVLAVCLHAVTFAAAHALAMYALARLFPGRLQGRAQGLFASLVYGLGGIAGALLAGQLAQAHGWSASFLGAAGMCVLALAAAYWGLHLPGAAIDPERRAD